MARFVLNIVYIHGFLCNTQHMAGHSNVKTLCNKHSRNEDVKYTAHDNSKNEFSSSNTRIEGYF